MDKINKKALWIAGCCVVLFLLIFFAFYNKGSESEEGVMLEEVLVDRSGLESDVTPNTTKSAPTAVKLTYQQAIDKYANTRIQFDDQCQARPNNVTYKSGTSIMLDNRAGVSRKIRVGSVYTVPAYDFKIVKVSSTVLPATWLVDCGASQNVATILIQK